MAQNDLPSWQAHGIGGFHIFQIADSHYGCAHNTSVVGSAGNGQSDNQVNGTGAQQGYDYNSLQNVRNGVKNIDAAHNDVIKLAAVETGNGAQNSAYYKTKAYGANADGQGITSAVHNASKQVSTVFIGTKPVLTVGRLQLVS